MCSRSLAGLDMYYGTLIKNNQFTIRPNLDLCLSYDYNPTQAKPPHPYFVLCSKPSSTSLLTVDNITGKIVGIMRDSFIYETSDA